MIASRGDSRCTEFRRLTLAIETSGEIIFTTDLHGTFTYVNPEFERAYGYASSDVVGRATPRILKSGSTDPEEYATFWMQLQQNRTVRREFLNRTKAGALLNIETSANAIVDDQGQAIGFLAVQRDVTAATEMAAALRESERRYRTLAEAAQDAIFIVNHHGQIEYTNDVGRDRFGLASGAVEAGKHLDEAFPGPTAAQMWRQLSVVFATGRRQLFEAAFASPAGERWIETWLVPLDRNDSGVRTVMGVARDVTERKTLEREFLQAQKMEAVGRLAGGIAHDFNNLLTAILGYSELLEERMGDVPDLRADLDEIKKAGERASRLTHQLLAYSRKQPAEPQVTNMNTVVTDIHTMLRRMLREDIALSVSPAADDPEVMADPGQLEQVVLNLAVNAGDAMPKGGALTITTGNAHLDETFVRQHLGTTEGRYVSLTVQDTGCGMPPEVIAHVFEPFFTTKPQGQGTGLGLSTVYGIVTRHGGCLTIDSRPDEGTTITVFWPVRAGGDASVTAAETVSRPFGGTETILLVDDEPGLRSLMRKSLEPYGYRILEAPDVNSAVPMAHGHEGRVDLLLSDVIMPGLNGPDLAQRIVAHRPDIKVLYVSGFPNALPAAQLPKRRHVAFLAKPFTPLELARKVRECLDA